MWIFKNYKLLTYQEQQKILKIRNSDYVKNVSNHNSTITLQEHQSWVKNLPNSKCYMALLINNNIVGGFNYTLENNIIKNWGIFFSKNTMPLISLIATYLFIQFMFEKSDVLYSEVLKTNKKALEFNKYFGIEIINKTDKLYKLKLTKKKWNIIKPTLSIYKRISKINYEVLC